MRVLIVSCVFPPEPITSAHTSADLARGLVEAGHQGTVITSFASRPGGRLHDGFRRSLRRVEEHDAGYRTIRTASLFSPRGTTTEKLLENISFGITSSLASLMEEADVVYVNTWPILAAGCVALLTRLRRQPLVLSVQDIHPETACGLGKLSRRSLTTVALKAIDRIVARQATVVVTISKNFAEYYRQARGLADDKVHVVPNWLDDERIVPQTGKSALRRTLGIDNDAFVVQYAGNVGTVAGVETVIETADCLRSDRDIVFVIAGDGSRRAACEQQARALKLDNVRFLYPWQSDQVSEVQAIADLMVLPTRKAGALTSVPSKLISYMLSGRPVLAGVNAESDSARIISQAQCGAVTDAEDAGSLAEEIRRLRGQPAELAQMARRARSYAETHFSRRACVPRLVDLLQQVAKHKSIWRQRSTKTSRLTDITIIPMKRHHVPSVVRVHLESFPGFFLSFLGPRFLATLYGEILREPGNVARVACDTSGRVVGFVAGIQRQAGFYARLAKRRWFAFAAASLSATLRRPAIVPRLLRALSQHRHSGAAAAPALLMSIAVSRASESNGIGTRLVQSFLTAMKVDGVDRVSLTTDRDDNDAVNQFYHRLGFRQVREFVTPEGRWMNEYLIDLTAVSPFERAASVVPADRIAA